MKRLLFIIAVATLVICGLHAQNSTFNQSSILQNNKSERFDIIKKEGKPVALFDKESQKKLSITGTEYGTLDKISIMKMSVSAEKSAKADVATIILHVIGDPWGNGTGVQMLIDADAEIVDHFWDWFWDNDELFYTNSEYKIPENASYNLTNPQVIHNGTGSVDIPGGIYDFIFFRPWPDFQMLFILNWEGTTDIAMGDDFTFLPGFEYVFTVETAGEVGFSAPEDITLSNIILPLSSLYLTNNEEVSVKIYNNGSENISGDLELAYKVNDGTEIIETYSVSELEPGKDITYTFNAKADFSEFGFFKVEARVEYDGDSNPYNNTIVGTTKKMKILELPFVEEFDTQSSMLNWSTIDGNGDGLSWEYDNWFLTDADGGVGCLQVLCQSYGANEYLITDPINIPEAGVFKMSFYAYALGDDKIKILYGKSFNVDDMKLVTVVYPASSDWDINQVDIEIEESGDYFFAFRYTAVYAEGDRGVNFDKVNMSFVPIVSIKDYEKKRMKLHPNPVSDILKVTLEDNTIRKVVVHNILGKYIYTHSNVNDFNFTLNTTDFPSGIYFISVHTDAGMVHSKFVVR